MEQYDNRVDAYIGKSADFAQPILNYIREIIHEASPLITETIKWGCPSFDYKGPIVMMAAFKQHCGLNLWKASLMDDPDGVMKLNDENAGQFSRITSIADLPQKNVLIDFIKQGVALNEKGLKVPTKKTTGEKAELVVPDYFTAALDSNPQAKANFDGFSYSQKKEYLEWFIEAKSEATRDNRVKTSVEWISEGKSRNWKYQHK
jgi:uncharacterized protein YdeI (YjbR/CyaY-like superfamily)